MIILPDRWLSCIREQHETAVAYTLDACGSTFETRVIQQEEEVGREQRRRADNALRKGRALKEELHRLKESRTVSLVLRVPVLVSTPLH